MISILLLFIGVILVVEALWLLGRLRGRARQSAVANCAAGGFFILALTSAVLNWPEIIMLIALGGAGVSHGLDLWFRVKWRSQRDKSG